MKQLLLLPILIILVGCGTSRTYDYPYETVAAVLKDKLIVNHDDFKNKKPVIYDTDGILDIYFESDIDYYFSIGTDISVRSKNAKTSTVTAKVIEYYKSWSYQSRSKKMERQFLDILGKRLKTGKWEKLPWEKKKDINRDLIPAIIEDINEND